MSDSPTELNQGVTTDSPTVDQGVQTDSPAVKDEGVKETLVDRINKLAEESPEKSPVSEESNQDSKVEEGKPDEQEDAPYQPYTEEEKARLHSKTRKRFMKTEGEIERLGQEVQSFKTDAESYNKVVGFLENNGLSIQDANDAFSILKDIKFNPAGALKRLMPIVQDLQKITGDVLPDDLADQVKKGYITEAHAQELSRHRANTAYQQTTQRNQEEQQKTQKVVETQRQIDAGKDAATKWENAWRSDPDYSKLQPEVQRLFTLELRADRDFKYAGPEAVVKLLDKLRDEVKARHVKAQPKTEIKHVTGGGSAAQTQRKPANTLEAINLALDG